MAKFRGGNVTFEMFFDRAKVLKRLQEKEVRVLSGTGAYGRTVVQRSMRDASKTNPLDKSQPGKPPKAHGRRLLKEKIAFGYDGRAHSVVIGSTPLNRKAKNNVPLTLEQGGGVSNARIRVKETRPDRLKRAKTLGIKKPTRFITKTIQLEPRPYLGPTSINHPKIITKFRLLIERNKLL